MNKRALDAINGSIAKWEAIVAGTGEDRGEGNCPLCHAFYSLDDSCDRCPIAKKVGDSFCESTPYTKWRRSFPDGKRLKANTPIRIELAKKELAFLKRLLPKEKGIAIRGTRGKVNT